MQVNIFLFYTKFTVRRAKKLEEQAKEKLRKREFYCCNK